MTRMLQKSLLVATKVKNNGDKDLSLDGDSSLGT